MESEGPYKNISETCIEGPGFETLPQKVFQDMDFSLLLNLAYAEGRKAERERCLSIVQAVMCVEDDLLNDIGKGIVKTIKTGGQDGE